MSEASQQSLLRSLPQVDEILRMPLIESLAQLVPRDFIASYTREAIDNARAQILSGQLDSLDEEDLVSSVCHKALSLQKPSLQPVINATGVIIHTNLGRSILAAEAAEAAYRVALEYSTLEYDINAQARGSRHQHYEQLICMLTGAEAALAVNNNAAAVLMVLSEFAAGKEAVVSRGELVEIGGSFRVPDIMQLSGTAMIEIGTTNKTHESDYEHAITPETSMLLKVHPSNYRMVGFTESVPIKSLRKLADKESERRSLNSCETSKVANDNTLDQHKSPGEILVYEDQGSGAFFNLECFGKYAEPTVAESLQAGADLVSFSGDKLLGGPQAGIIVGSKCLIDRLKKNPLARALRLDKMTLAALEATLKIYLDKEEAFHRIPTLEMLTSPASTMKDKAETLKALLDNALQNDMAKVDIVPEVSRAGGGSMPMCDIDTYAVSLDFLKGTAQTCETYLITKWQPPIIARINHERLLFDVRTILSTDQMTEIADALTAYFSDLGECH